MIDYQNEEEVAAFCASREPDSRNTLTVYGGHDGTAKLREEPVPAWFLGERAGRFWYAEEYRSRTPTPQKEKEFVVYWDSERLPQW